MADLSRNAPVVAGLPTAPHTRPQVSSILCGVRRRAHKMASSAETADLLRRTTTMNGRGCSVLAPPHVGGVPDADFTSLGPGGASSCSRVRKGPDRSRQHNMKPQRGDIGSSQIRRKTTGRSSPPAQNDRKRSWLLTPRFSPLVVWEAPPTPISLGVSRPNGSSERDPRDSSVLWAACATANLLAVFVLASPCGTDQQHRRRSVTATRQGETRNAQYQEHK